MNCSRCCRALMRNLCVCCDLPRTGSFAKTPICEHRPEFEEFVAWAAGSEVSATYLTWWNVHRKPKSRIEISSASHSPFGDRLPETPAEEPLEVAPITPIPPIEAEQFFKAAETTLTDSALAGPQDPLALVS